MSFIKPASPVDVSEIAQLLSKFSENSAASLTDRRWRNTQLRGNHFSGNPINDRTPETLPGSRLKFTLDLLQSTMNQGPQLLIASWFQLGNSRCINNLLKNGDGG
jgi:hypothetical protein